MTHLCERSKNIENFNAFDDLFFFKIINQMDNHIEPFEVEDRLTNN